MDIKIGVLAYSSKTGLGYQTRNLAQHIEPSKILIVDISHLNQMEVDHDWAPNAKITSWPNETDLEWLTDNIDIIFICETPLDFNLYNIAQRKGVKVVNQYNYEFCDRYQHPTWPEPDIYAAPTTWGKDKLAEQTDKPIIDLPVPIDRNQFPYRHRTKLKSFIHIIGRPTYEDRNGTLTYLEAIKYYEGKANHKIFYQTPKDPKAIAHFQPVLDKISEMKHQYNIEIHTDVDNPVEIYNQGDILVLPRRYGGLCLPMQEALSCGLPVIMTDIDPNNQRLPADWLISATYKNSFFFHAPVDVYEGDPIELAQKMLQYDDSTFLKQASTKANWIAETLSWDTLKPEYQTKLKEII